MINRNIEIINRSDNKLKEELGKLDKYNTLAAIQKELKNLDFYIQNEEKEISRQINKSKGVYDITYLNKVKEESLVKLKEELKPIIEKTQNNIKKYEIDKKDKIVKMLIDPPKESHIQLLNALNMRNNLDSFEVQSILPSLYTNYQAMKVFSDIAETKGITIFTPLTLDPQELYHTTTEAVEYLLEASEELLKDKEKKHEKFKAFYFSKQGDDKNYDPFFEKYTEVLDNTVLLRDIQVKKSTLTPSEELTVNKIYKEIDKDNELDMIATTMKAIEDKPSVKALIELTPYAKYIIEEEKDK